MPNYRAGSPPRAVVAEADAVVKLLESDVRRFAAHSARPCNDFPRCEGNRPLRLARTVPGGIYLKRTIMIWGLWRCAYMINNGLVTWLPTLYKQVFHLPLQTSLAYGWITSGVGSHRFCGLRPVDRQGRSQALVRDAFLA